MDKQSLRSKFLGSLIGSAAGDALGASLEGWWEVDAGEVWALAEKHEVLSYTDDTHMMIGVAESLVENRGFDGEHMAQTFIRNYQHEPWRGYGPGPPHIFRLIKSGQAWDKAAESVYGGGSLGNGAAMRVAPIGIFYFDDPAKLREITYKSSQITHAHQLGKEGAALEAYAIALATKLDPSLPFEDHDFWGELNDFVEHEVYKQKLGKMKNLLGEADKLKVTTELGNGIEAFNSVPAAIYSFLSHPKSFEEAVVYAISLGGDTDTIGAMTGAISGAYLGIPSIPNKWHSKLENRAYIEKLAQKLWEIKGR